MTRKYLNHTLQNNPQHHEEELQNSNSHKTAGRQAKQSNLISLSHKDDLKQEWTQSTAQQNREQTQNPTM